MMWHRYMSGSMRDVAVMLVCGALGLLAVVALLWWRDASMHLDGWQALVQGAVYGMLLWQAVMVLSLSVLHPLLEK